MIFVNIVINNNSDRFVRNSNLFSNDKYSYKNDITYHKGLIKIDSFIVVTNDDFVNIVINNNSDRLVRNSKGRLFNPGI